MRNAASEFTERIEKARGILLAALLVLALLVLPACSGDEAPATGSAEAPASQEQPAQATEDPEEPGAPEPAPSDGGQLAEPVVFDLSQVPAYDGSPYAAINDNVPTIGEDDIPAQSEYLLRLDIARAIGVDQSMSLLDALQRIGQVLGPLCTGAVLLLMNVDEAARIIGAGFIIISLAFLALGRPAARTNTETA